LKQKNSIFFVKKSILFIKVQKVIGCPAKVLFIKLLFRNLHLIF